ncbi:unnamed protein product [Dovyalis caffra]|uniref:Uncharacterized protein n=1 Tax=Dovyalis caffra TaxID=77055 RepID=A0AAV1RJ94_9ROSI|nr:unnamed protein product [Dovyalis caffra]
MKKRVLANMVLSWKLMIEGNDEKARADGNRGRVASNVGCSVLQRKKLHQCLTSGRLGATITNPDAIVVDIEGACSFLGEPLKESENPPDLLKFAEACGIPAARVTRKDDLGKIQKMLHSWTLHVGCDDI